MDDLPNQTTGDARPEPIDLGDEVWLIDTRMGGYTGITAGYLIRGEKPALVETGAATSAAEVVEVLSDLGVDANDLATMSRRWQTTSRPWRRKHRPSGKRSNNRRPKAC